MLERAGIFLTNSLTGWDFAGENPKLANWPELESERKGAGKVKHEKILVVLGNPPYNAYAGISPEEEQGLVEPYKEGLVKQWGIKKFNLDDLYIRFFRLAERRIAEKTGKGIVCFISNHSWISDQSFVVLRQHLLRPRRRGEDTAPYPLARFSAILCHVAARLAEFVGASLRAGRPVNFLRVARRRLRAEVKA